MMATTGSILRVPVPDLCALWAESATAPMNIALIGVLDGTPLVRPDGAIDLARIRSFVERASRERRCCCAP
jgi:hypothetical protein